MMPKRKVRCVCGIVLLIGAAKADARSHLPLQLESTIPLPDVKGRIDHLAFDIENQRLFVAALGNNTVQVIDIKSGKPVRRISYLCW
jgi:hypothetical protein